MTIHFTLILMVNISITFLYIFCAFRQWNVLKTDSSSIRQSRQEHGVQKKKKKKAKKKKKKKQKKKKKSKKKNNNTNMISTAYLIENILTSS